MRGDADFSRMAPNYATLRPFERDSSLVVRSRSELEAVANPATTFEEHFQLRLNKPMAVRLIVADSTGNGLISYEFANLAAGTYTLGSKGWPQPQIKQAAGLRWVYLYFVGDQRFRSRYQCGLNSEMHLTWMAPTAPPTPPTTEARPFQQPGVIPQGK